MRLMYPQCAAIDVHKKTAVVCPRQTEREGRVKSEVQTFGMTTPELLQMMNWLSAWEVTTVAIESTAEYWKPVFNLLEGEFGAHLAHLVREGGLLAAGLDLLEGERPGHVVLALLIN